MAKFNQNNFEVCAISLALDLTEAFGHLSDDFLNEFAYPCIGNAAHECVGFSVMDEQKPTVQGSLGGISFFQWTGMKASGRRSQFMALCRRKKLHPYSYEAAREMVLAELRDTEKRALAATIGAQVKANTPAPRNIMMARVVAFEVNYERAGVKHYPSRYQWAMRAKQAVEAWIASGFIARPGYRPPGGTFNETFAKEFGALKSGPGLSPVRGARVLGKGGLDNVPGPNAGPVLVSDEIDEYQAAQGGDPVVLTPVAQDGPAIELTPPEPEPPAAYPMPPVRKAAGKFAEDLLSPAEIKVIQSRLRDLGWVSVGKIDGFWGTTFVVPTIKALQAKAGATSDGHYGPETKRLLEMGVRFDPPAGRAEATPAKLLAAGEPTTKAAEKIKATSLWTGITGGATVVGSALMQYAGDAWAIVKDARSTFDNIPGWVWGIAIIAIAVYLFRKGDKVQAIRVDEERSGANTALAAPLATPPAERPWDTSQLPGVVAGGGYQPGAYGGEPNPPSGGTSGGAR